MQSAEDNKALASTFLEEFLNKANIAVVDELVAPDFVNHSPGPGMPPDREGLKRLVAYFRSAFPDAHTWVEHLVAEGDKVVCHVTVRGTQQGAFLGIAPTGRSVTWSAFTMLRMANGKIAERWSAQDNLALMMRLGAKITAPGSRDLGMHPVERSNLV